MKTSTFKAQAKEILLKYFKPNDCPSLYDYSITTYYGELLITFSPSPKIGVYSINMRFSEKEKVNQTELLKWLGGSLNQYSLKWNICEFDAETVLNDFDERLRNLLWMETKTLKTK